MKTIHHLALTALASLAALLAGCGGGAGAGGIAPPTETPAAVATLVQGTITGFGSIIVDGARLDDSVAKVAFNLDPGSATPGTLSDLKLGQRVDAKLVDGKLSDVVVSFALVGAVDSVDMVNATLVVLGRKIKLVLTGATPTAIEGFTQLSELAAGDLVKVAGTANADHTVSATRIERKLADAHVRIRVTGVVGELDATAKTFTFGGERKMKVDFANANVLPSGATVANGKMLAVYADTAPIAGGALPVLTAKAVEVLERKLQEGAELGLGGNVSDFVSLANFKIGEVTVDALAAALVDGTVAADVANGARVMVKGNVTNRVLVAKSIKVAKPENEDKPRLIGQVNDFVTAAQFKLRGVTVDASHATFSGGTLADLGNGAYLDVTGHMVKDSVVADMVRVMPPPTAVAQTLAGLIRGWDAASQSFTLLGVDMKLAPTATFAPLGQTMANMANERPVVVKGSFSEATHVFTVSALEFKEPVATVRRIDIGGVISGIVDGGFKFGDAVIRVTPNTTLAPSGASSTQLRPGAQVRVVALLDTVAHTITALSVEVMTLAEPASTSPTPTSGSSEPTVVAVRFHGLVTDFVSLANLRVAGQKVNASAAGVVFVGGSAANISNGTAIGVEGTLSAASAVVTVTKVYFPAS